MSNDVNTEAKRERDAKQPQAPENQPVAPVVVAADVSRIIDENQLPSLHDLLGLFEGNPVDIAGGWE